MSDSVQPHRRQPTRLHHPWDCSGKNTGVGCHFLLQCMKVKSEIEVAQSCLTLQDPTDCSLPGSSVHGIIQATVLEWGAIAFCTIKNTNLNIIISSLSMIHKYTHEYISYIHILYTCMYLHISVLLYSVIYFSF